MKKIITDLELLDKYATDCIEFISPVIFREIEKRGLTYIVNNLNSDDINERKSLIRVKLILQGKYIAKDKTQYCEIEEISQMINRVQILRNQLNNINIADVILALPIVEEINEILNKIKNYYK